MYSCRKFLSSPFTHFFRQFFWAHEWTPPIFSLLECMPWSSQGRDWLWPAQKGGRLLRVAGLRRGPQGFTDVFGNSLLTCTITGDQAHLEPWVSGADRATNWSERVWPRQAVQKSSKNPLGANVSVQLCRIYWPSTILALPAKNVLIQTCFSGEQCLLLIPCPVSYTHLTLPTNREV